MIYLSDNIISYDGTRCQQCGACSAICPKYAISLHLLNSGLHDIIINHELCISCKKCLKVCPSNREMNNDHKSYFHSLIQKRYFLASNKDMNIRSSSSSGGATKTIVVESLKQRIVDGVYTLRSLDRYPSAIGEFYTIDNLPTYDSMPNSIYHSIMACKDLAKVSKVERLMIVGTSCQLYALEKALKGKYHQLIKVCIFCKQQKTLLSTRWLAKISGHKLPLNLDFTVKYRGDGWPGHLCVMGGNLKWEHAAGLPFGRRLWTVPGCDICGDPFGIEVSADLTMMDPWSICRSNPNGDTLVTCHSRTGLDLLLSLSDLHVEETTYDFVKPALGLEDIWRKRICVPKFNHQIVEPVVDQAVNAEVKQRNELERLLGKLPRLPFVFYRLLNKLIPKKRDAILKIDFKL